MAGLEFRFTLDDRELMAQVDALVERGDDLSEAWEDIGQDMVTVTTRAFERSQSPEGIAWLPSAAALEDGRKTLIERGTRGGLMNSFSYAVLPMGVVYGTNMVHAAIHQFGGSFEHAAKRGSADAGTGFGAALAAAIVTLPARPFVGYSAADLQRWERTLADQLAGGAA